MSDAILTQQVDYTTYTVSMDLPRNLWVVEAHTRIPSRATCDGLEWQGVRGPNDDVLPPNFQVIPAVDERWHATFDACMFEGDTMNQATEALAAGMNKIQPKVEENARRRERDDQTLQEHERQLREEARIRELKAAAEAELRAAIAREKAEREQDELEALPGYGMF